jgi:hypothetical protein
MKLMFTVPFGLWLLFKGCGVEPFGYTDSPITVADDSIKADGEGYDHRDKSKKFCEFKMPGKHAQRIEVYDAGGTLYGPYSVWSKSWSITTSDGFGVIVAISDDTVHLTSSKDLDEDTAAGKKTGCSQQDIKFMPPGNSATLQIDNSSTPLAYPRGRVVIHYCKNSACS